MKSFIFPKSKISNFLEAIAGSHQLWIPTDDDGLVDFRRHDGGSELCLDSKSRRSAKGFFFPQWEEMLSLYVCQGDPVVRWTESTRSVQQQVVFGVRPCDAKAVQLLAMVFLSSHTNLGEDTYFRRRLDSTILIGWACNFPDPTCFCNAVGGHPHGQEGLDALMIDLGEDVLVRLLTDRAGPVVARYSMAEADDASLSKATCAAETALATLPKGLKPGGPSCEDTEALLALPLWEATAERCLNCGICTYLCPTCSCFDILDQTKPNGGCRFRTWDSCMFSLFTQHASGYNPRSTKARRLRQRFMHKFKYFPARNNGRLSCVGCGRCVEFCPVNIDIREMAEMMTALNGA